MLCILDRLADCGVGGILAKIRMVILISPALSHTHVTTASTMISAALNRTHLTTVSTISSALISTQPGDIIRVQAIVHITAVMR